MSRNAAPKNVKAASAAQTARTAALFEAESIYRLALAGRVTKPTAVRLAERLEARSPFGAAYLRWLLMRHASPS